MPNWYTCERLFLVDGHAALILRPPSSSSSDWPERHFVSLVARSGPLLSVDEQTNKRRVEQLDEQKGAAPCAPVVAGAISCSWPSARRMSAKNVALVSGTFSNAFEEDEDDFDDDGNDCFSMLAQDSIGRQRLAVRPR